MSNLVQKIFRRVRSRDGAYVDGRRCLLDGTGQSAREAEAAPFPSRNDLHAAVERLRDLSNQKAGPHAHLHYEQLAAARREVERLSFLTEDSAAQSSLEEVAQFPPDHITRLGKDGTLRVYRPRTVVRDARSLAQRLREVYRPTGTGTAAGAASSTKTAVKDLRTLNQRNREFYGRQS